MPYRCHGNSVRIGVLPSFDGAVPISIVIGALPIKPLEDAVSEDEGLMVPLDTVM